MIERVRALEVTDGQERDQTVEREHACKGFEVGKAQYVKFTEAEVKALRPEQFEHLSIEHFVPAASVDPIYFEKTIYLAPESLVDRCGSPNGSFLVDRIRLY